MDTTPRPQDLAPTSTPAGRPRVLLLFGGRSGEHAISCATAGGVLRAIDRDRYDVIPVGITPSGRWVGVDPDPDAWSITNGRLPQVADAPERVLLPQSTDERSAHVLADGLPPRDLGRIDVVFPLLHGPFGEDGTVQGMLELADLRYVGAGVLASAVGMDKQFMKLVLAGQGLPIGPYTVLRPGELDRDPDGVRARLEPLGLPLFVKPARAGSSLGITRVTDLADLPAAVAEAERHDPKVIIEAAIVGREIECAVLGSPGAQRARASLPGEIVVTDARHDFYDFEAKYLAEADVELSCPADLPADIIERVRDVAVRTFEAVDCEGLARVDVFVTEAGEVVVNEINTMPGFTPFSMYPRMWEASGLPYSQLVDELLQLALHRPTGLR
ncbi:D-alanine--D-alanine ligase family protein [Cellulomonas chengniuliangii]|uniref:D-alanine--D-alanine ligase n=1 Tax=Cellulomonas chengniuliangii TaxID=2968084 RepID=A0ABY5L0N6_9CELL|nr:D-alanine--D-alanine ligase family protein [Cellulomonas chengniuliangii]MCC2309905.1 D-alanine--D-alanine ligase [Cellulomonas chengniuliangii]MCC2318164.1 D-alanine--D-alanine ligase [Cellulomonas chengniuliangii]UUI76347.1 D-alanine--D-alanine ligase [Cellulomonas chengniuliangii]